ncbi:hypothetical protein [Solidesulfovibrio alcoholivorans]|uniref:hypothetical protein n=1 Tax=Solidesulfovibrio alcoholivorans TaxID=81406 RepID=UPI000497C06A|nr:hypothetical protein [Solidesulfovibrio alcoholivorans]
MDQKTLQEIVFNTMERYGEEEGRRVLMARLASDPAFEGAATRYGLEILKGAAEAESAPKQ